MGFRELAHAHNDLHKAHAETRGVLVQLIGSHNGFIHLPFWQRLRWLFRGVPPPPTPPPAERTAE